MHTLSHSVHFRRHNFLSGIAFLKSPVSHFHALCNPFPSVVSGSSLSIVSYIQTLHGAPAHRHSNPWRDQGVEGLAVKKLREGDALRKAPLCSTRLEKKQTNKLLERFESGFSLLRPIFTQAHIALFQSFAHVGPSLPLERGREPFFKNIYKTLDVKDLVVVSRNKSQGWGIFLARQLGRETLLLTLLITQ